MSQILNKIISSLTHSVDVSSFERKIRVLELEISALKRARRSTLPVVDASVADPIPSDESEREAYVSQFARFYDAFLEKKLIHLIAQVREDLDWSGWSDYEHPDGLPKGMKREEYDAYLRGTSNAFRLLMDYGCQMRNELASYQLKVKDM